MKKISTIGLSVLVSFISLACVAQGRSAYGDRHADAKAAVDGNHFNSQRGNDQNWNEQRGRDDRMENKRFDQSYNNHDHDLRHNEAAGNQDYGRDRNVRGQGGYPVIRNTYVYNNVRERQLYGGGFHTGAYDNSYDRIISNEACYAAGRVMDRENDNGRLLYAERIADENYLYAEQVKELASYFSFDDNRLAFARYAYNKTIDKENFGVVGSAFVSNEGRNELMRFLNSCR